MGAILLGVMFALFIVMALLWIAGAALLGWPDYRVYQQEINEEAKALKLWMRRKRGNRKLVCSGCGRRVSEIHEVYEREARDLPCFEYRTTVVIELYRVRCPDVSRLAGGYLMVSRRLQLLTSLSIIFLCGQITKKLSSVERGSSGGSDSRRFKDRCGGRFIKIGCRSAGA